MTNKYEERLGTERMLPLVFKMALPAVAAQFCQSALQHCRPYLHRTHTGHRNRCAGGSGSDHFARCADFFFLCHCGWWRCSVGCHCPRTGQPSPCRKDTWQWLYSVDSFTLLTSFIAYTFMEPILLFYGCFGAYAGLCGRLSFHLSVGDAVCGSVYRTECFHQCTGAPCGCHVFGVDRGFVEYYS